MNTNVESCLKYFDFFSKKDLKNLENIFWNWFYHLKNKLGKIVSADFFEVINFSVDLKKPKP